jgi:PhnB protein
MEERWKTRLNPYLSFRDNALQAMEFHWSVFGGKLTMNTFKGFYASQDPGEDDKIVHDMLEAENGITFMAADTPYGMEYRPGANISMSLSGDNEKELRSCFEKLSPGGQITIPLEKAPWGDTFGMCTDRFGVNWMVNITAQASPQGRRRPGARFSRPGQRLRILGGSVGMKPGG